jgi:hypothetical protein
VEDSTKLHQLNCLLLLKFMVSFIEEEHVLAVPKDRTFLMKVPLI